MLQNDYILRVAEDVDRALAQIISHQDMRDYQGALSLIDEVCRQRWELILILFMPSPKRPC
jgi:hypothetical protein